MKKKYTKSIKAGMSEKDAKKAAEVAGKNAAKKANYTAPLPTPQYKQAPPAAPENNQPPNWE
jgi:hypothetical protein